MLLSLPLVLASASPRRQQMLRQLVKSFEVEVANVPELREAGESPINYVARLARQKAEAVSPKFPEHWVLGSDTIVVMGDQVFEKPVDQQDAIRMLSALSNSTHEVMTAIALAKGNKVLSDTVITRVTFRALSEQEILAYWHTQEPCDKAGSYGIQGLGGSFVERIEGSYSAVVGLPLCQTHQLLTTAIQEN